MKLTINEQQELYLKSYIAALNGLCANPDYTENTNASIAGIAGEIAWEASERIEHAFATIQTVAEEEEEEEARVV